MRSRLVDADALGRGDGVARRRGRGLAAELGGNAGQRAVGAAAACDAVCPDDVGLRAGVLGGVRPVSPHVQCDVAIHCRCLSHWIYIAHLPLVVWLQVQIGRWPQHWTVKYRLILAITMPVLLLSYKYLVRSTFIGQQLNGRKYN